MNSNTNKMAGISALPLLIILGLILGAGYLLMGGEFDFDMFKEDNTLELRRLEGFPTEVAINNAELDKQRLVIRSEEELVDFLATVETSDELSVGEKINFEEEMLVGVSTEAFDSTGYSVKIRKVYIDKENNELLVSSLITEPGDNCITAQTLTSAVDIVAIDKTDLTIDFETLRKKDLCD